LDRALATADLSGNEYGQGRELFANFRKTVGAADTGASSI
jgi:phosphogluconate dehydratase